MQDSDARKSTGMRASHELFKNVACPFCGMLCDDLEIERNGDALKVLKNGCGRSVAGFERKLPPSSPKIRGKEVTLAEAVKEAASLISRAGNPLVGGLGTDYFLIAPVAARDPSAPKLAPAIGGFGAWTDDELGLLVCAHDPLDPENRDARKIAITLRVSRVPFERAAIAEGSDAPATLTLADGVLELSTDLPANGFRCFRIRRAP